jgi:hypothetical protein
MLDADYWMLAHEHLVTSIQHLSCSSRQLLLDQRIEGRQQLGCTGVFSGDLGALPLMGASEIVFLNRNEMRLGHRLLRWRRRIDGDGKGPRSELRGTRGNDVSLLVPRCSPLR